MRTERVVTNLRCNQNCTYCTSRSDRDDPEQIRAAAVRARIDDAVRAGAEEIVLTGGEPGMRRDLEDLVRAARSAGAAHVTLETNATIIDAARARALRNAGLDRARVNLVGVTDAVDEVTRDPGGFARTLAGIDALVAAGVDVCVCAAIVRSTLTLVGELPDLVAARGVRTMEVSVPTRAPNASALVAFDDAARAIAALEPRARAAQVTLRMSRSDGVPPCLFPPAAGRRFEHLYALTPGAPRRPDHAQVAACDACVVRDRCAGLPRDYLARRPPPPMTPIRDERTRRRLSIVSSVEDQIARELVSQSLTATSEGAAIIDEVIRINFQCNQSCAFCFVSTHLPPARDEAIRRAIEDAGRRGAKISLSGGEPTLNARLLDYVRLAKTSGARLVTLQTNAIRLDDASLVAALQSAGLDEAFVSLHGCTAETSDRVTEAPGTFARTVVGVGHLARSTIRTTLNFVVCETNRQELVEFVRFVAARWPSVGVNVSFIAPSTDLVPRDRALVPRYSDVLPALAEAAAEAARLGVRLGGWESMCGVPLCLVPASLEDTPLAAIPPGFDGGEFTKVDACGGCKYDATCYGVRRGYAALHGTSELRNVPR